MIPHEDIKPRPGTPPSASDSPGLSFSPHLQFLAPEGSCSSARFRPQLWAGAGPPVRAQSHSTAPLQTSLASPRPHVLLTDCLKMGVPRPLLGCCEFARVASRAPRNTSLSLHSLWTEGRRVRMGSWGSQPPCSQGALLPQHRHSSPTRKLLNLVFGVLGRSHPIGTVDCHLPLVTGSAPRVRAGLRGPAVSSVVAPLVTSPHP